MITIDGIPAPAIASRALDLGLISLPSPRPRNNHQRGRYAQVDWTLLDHQIAAALGVSRQAVHQARTKLGYRGLSRPRPRPDPYAGIDWSLTNRQIAARRGVTRETVWIARRRRHIPQP